jgi:hypothetical protein
MEFALGKIYAKFYICQILNSTNYYEMKKKEFEFQAVLDENLLDDSGKIILT